MDKAEKFRGTDDSSLYFLISPFLSLHMNETNELKQTCLAQPLFLSHRHPFVTAPPFLLLCACGGWPRYALVFCLGGSRLIIHQRKRVKLSKFSMLFHSAQDGKKD